MNKFHSPFSSQLDRKYHMHRLYYSPGSCSLAVNIALEEAAIPHELHSIDLLKGEQLSDAFKTLNPLGRVPVLRLPGEKYLTEVPAILHYISNSKPTAQLLPVAPYEAAQSLEWMSLFVSSVHPAFLHFYRPSRFVHDEGAYDVLKEAGLSDYLRLLQLIESKLSTDGITVGNSFTLVDSYAFIFYLWAFRFDMNLSAMPRYKKLAQRILARPATRRALESEGLESVIDKMLEA